MPVTKHHPVDTNSVAVIVLEQELPERAVLVRQRKLVNVEYGHPCCFVLEVLAEMLVSASLNGITRSSHDAAFVAIFENDVSDRNLAVVVVKVKMINALDQIVIYELEQIGFFIPYGSQQGQKISLLRAAGGRADGPSGSPGGASGLLVVLRVRHSNLLPNYGAVTTAVK